MYIYIYIYIRFFLTDNSTIFFIGIKYSRFKEYMTNTRSKLKSIIYKQQIIHRNKYSRFKGYIANTKSNYLESHFNVEIYNNIC